CRRLGERRRGRRVSPVPATDDRLDEFWPSRPPSSPSSVCIIDPFAYRPSSSVSGLMQRAAGGQQPRQLWVSPRGGTAGVRGYVPHLTRAKLVNFDRPKQVEIVAPDRTSGIKAGRFQNWVCGMFSPYKSYASSY
ncbi:hypothetical protein THAOC_23083, partial [Thalassiosira oceanica]